MRLVRLIPLFALGACFQFTDVSVADEPAPEEFPRLVRVTRTDGTVLDLDAARLESGVIHGTRRQDMRMFAIPVAEVARVEHLSFSWKRTAHTLAAMAVIWVLIDWSLPDPYQCFGATASSVCPS